MPGLMHVRDVDVLRTPDGAVAAPAGVETVDDEADRKLLLRRIGYKL
jgi:adenosine/AMP kinase